MQIWSLIWKLLWWIKSKQSTSKTGRIKTPFGSQAKVLLRTVVQLDLSQGPHIKRCTNHECSTPAEQPSPQEQHHAQPKFLHTEPRDFTSAQKHRRTQTQENTSHFYPAKDAAKWHNHYFTLNSPVVKAKVHYPEILLSLCCTASCWKGRMH